MNSIMTQFAGLLRLNHDVRDELWDVLNDEALKHHLGGHTMTLGELYKEMGEVEYAYAQSFRTFKQDFSYRRTEPGLETSVDRLHDWFRALDAELTAALEQLSDADIQGKMIDREDGNQSIATNFHFYREGLLMFCAKASLYLRSLQIALPERFNAWVG